MIDRLGRSTPRFPPECEACVAHELGARLDAFGAGPDDVAITQGACGADLLFAEAMLERGATLRLHLPLDEEVFIQTSVDFDKPASSLPDHWRERFLAVKAHPLTHIAVLHPDQGHQISESVFERCNAWMLERALAYGANKLRFICVWNGEGDDGRGGTDHMRTVVKRHGGAECWIDTRKLCVRR